MNSPETNGKIAYVTGATSGLGFAIAHKLSKEGYIVYGAGRRKPSVETTWPFTYVPVDVTQKQSIIDAQALILSKHHHIDLLVCAAGFGISGAIEDIPIEEATAQFDVNFFGVVRVVRELLPVMRSQKKGKIIIIGSIAGKTGMPFQAYYSASKFALEGFVESLRYEMKPFDVEAALVEPGDFKTGFTGARTKIIPDGSAFKSLFNRVMSVQEHDEMHGQDPYKVAKRVVRLARKKHLPTRITVGPLFERFAVWIRRILPDSWFEAFYRIYYKL
jgi:short-subunit dehydrogenase